jgi:thiamine biosynthesis lipoprotein
VRRAQVWLGTLVEVALPSADATEAHFAAAFSAIEQVHRRMHPQQKGSDLQRIARVAHVRAVRVHPRTFELLQLAQTLWRESAGAFDPSLPAHGGADLGALELLSPGCRVRTRAALQLDLGGIAKGHAVDLAVAALRARGCRRAVVNAGGDLRCLGDTDWHAVKLRLPHRTAHAALMTVRDIAVATSADTYRAPGTGLRDGDRGRRAQRYDGSVTVFAPSCALADALTKLVALQPQRARRWLRRHRAHALRIDRNGAAVTTLEGDDPHVRLGPP